MRKPKTAEGLPGGSSEVKDSTHSGQTCVLCPREAGTPHGEVCTGNKTTTLPPFTTHAGELQFLVSFFSYWKVIVGRELTRENTVGTFPLRKNPHLRPSVQRSQKETALVDPPYPARTRHALLKPVTTRRQLPDNRSLCRAQGKMLRPGAHSLFSVHTPSLSPDPWLATTSLISRGEARSVTTRAAASRRTGNCALGPGRLLSGMANFTPDSPAEAPRFPGALQASSSRSLSPRAGPPRYN